MAVALALPLALGAAPAASAATPPNGAFAEAYGLLIDTTLLAGNVPVNVGPLAPTSSSCPPPTGLKETELLGGGDAQVAEAAVLSTAAGTDCTDKESLAGAQTLDVDALGVIVAAAIHTDEVTSTAEVSCAAAPEGFTDIVNLTVGGTPVPLPDDIPPNFDLLPELFGPLGIRVILNEQHPAASGRGIVVNGIHIITSGGGTIPVGGNVLRGDVVISHAAAGVVCPGGPGSALGGLPAPDITFTKVATPTSIKAGQTVTYQATARNTSQAPCEVLKFIDHVSPPFTLVSSSGPLGTALEDPAPVRADGGVDAVLRPTGVTIAPGASVTQTFVVKAKANAAPGTYYNNLEIYCGLGGNFVSGPLAPVTILAPVTPAVTVVDRPAEQLPRTGGAPLVALAAVLLVGAGVSLNRMRQPQG